MSIDRSIGIYIHIPFCKAKCGYCAFVSTPNRSSEREYVGALVGEIERSGRRGASVDTVYIGGGTPSCLYRGGLTEILSAVKKNFDVDKNAEITVEANPESCSDQFVDECVGVGVNRVSMGLQASDDAVLRGIGRIHSFADFIAAVKRLPRVFDNISSDIILGLPGQTKSDVRKSLDAVTEYCDHASVYALSVEEGTPLWASGYAPDDDYVAELYELAYSTLTARGFSRYEVSNFCRNGKASRHNTKYWRCEEYLGFGAAAHGYDGKRKRYKHGDDICEYISNCSVEETVLSDKDLYNEYIMLALRTERGIDRADFRKRFDRDVESFCGKVLRELSSKKLVIVTNERIAVAPEKMFVMNGIIESMMLD